MKKSVLHAPSKFKIPCSIFNIHQLPLDPPVLIGFLEGPAALAPGLAINFDPCEPPF